MCCGFVDTLILFKKILPQSREKYSQDNLVRDLLGTCYSIHDSLKDVRALQQLVSCKEVKQGSRLTFQLASPVASARFDSLAKTNFSLARHSNTHYRIKSSKC